MTVKQKQILQAALELFSKESYHATSTQQIAKKAGVSEGLIFRHFKNKEGLLQAVIQEVASQINILFLPILKEDNSKEIIKKTLKLPFIINECELDFWRLQFKLKWELYQNKPNLMNPLEEKLKNAFSDLKYRKPTLETALLLLIIESTIASIVQDQIKNKNRMQEFLLQKYHF